MASLRDRIINKDDLKTSTVYVPEWEETLTIKSLTGTERDAFEASMVEVNKNGSTKQNLKNVRARLVALTVIDPEDKGFRVFSDKDIEALGKKSAAALDRVFSAAQKLNGFTQEDVEEMAKGFDDAQSESSISD